MDTKACVIQRRRAVRRTAAGFSLIEILVVMALIGIIIALVAKRITDATVRAQVKATQIAIDTLASKIQTYAVDIGTPPARLDDLLTAPAEATSWMGPYAQEGDLKDAWGRALVYRQDGQRGEFDLGSWGFDGKPGGAGLRAADIGRP